MMVFKYHAALAKVKVRYLPSRSVIVLGCSQQSCLPVFICITGQTDFASGATSFLLVLIIGRWFLVEDDD